MKHWILKDGNIQEASLSEWSDWFEDPRNRKIEHTEINDDVYVSTVFLGLDHSFCSEGPAVLFETMVFGGDKDSFQDRYATLGEAKRGHYEVVERLRGK